jgi:hypothetical protein
MNSGPRRSSSVFLWGQRSTGGGWQRWYRSRKMTMWWSRLPGFVGRQFKLQMGARWPGDKGGADPWLGRWWGAVVVAGDGEEQGGWKRAESDQVQVRGQRRKCRGEPLPCHAREDKVVAHVGHQPVGGPAATERWWVVWSRPVCSVRRRRCAVCLVWAGPKSRLNLFPNMQTTSKLCNSNRMPSWVPKMFKPLMRLYFNPVNNFLHWSNFKFPMDHML